MELTQNSEEKIGKYERSQARQDEKDRSSRQIGRKKMFKRVLIWTIAVLFIGGSVYGLVKVASRTSVPNQAATELEIPVSDSDWRRGKLDAKVTLVEYADFQCPACGLYFPLVKQLEQELGDQVQFVFRHYPIRQIHKNADLAARTAEAAGRQDKFWEMHDMLFLQQKVWSAKTEARAEFEKYASDLGLNLEQFKKDLDDAAIKDRINDQLVGGNNSGVHSTPTFFLNGKLIQNPSSYEQFKSALTSAAPSVTP